MVNLKRLVFGLVTAAVAAQISSFIARKCNDKKEAKASSSSSPTDPHQTVPSSKSRKQLKSHSLASGKVKVDTTAIVVVNASSLRSKGTVSTTSMPYSFRFMSFYEYIPNPSHLFGQMAYIMFCRLHILRAVAAMLQTLENLLVVCPISCLPGTALIPAACLLNGCYALIRQNPDIMCPDVEVALRALEAFVNKAYAAVSLTPEVLLLEYYPADKGEEKSGSETQPSAPASSASATAPAVCTASTPAPTTAPASRCAPPGLTRAAAVPAAREDAPRGFPTPNNSNKELYFGVLGVMMATYRESVIAGLMSFVWAHEYLLGRSRAGLASVIEYAAQVGDFVTPTEVSAMKSDLSNMDGALASSRSSRYSSSSSLFEKFFSKAKNLALITAVSFIGNTAEGYMAFNATTRAVMLQSCGVVIEFLRMFSAQLDAGNVLFWSSEAREPFYVVGAYALNNLVALQVSQSRWFNENSALSEALEEMRTLWIGIEAKLEGPSFRHVDHIAYVIPDVSIERLESGSTSGNATPLSDTGGVLAADADAAIAAVAGEEKKKKRTRRGKKKNKRFNNYNHNKSNHYNSNNTITATANNYNNYNNDYK